MESSREQDPDLTSCPPHMSLELDPGFMAEAAGCSSPGLPSWGLFSALHCKGLHLRMCTTVPRRPWRGGLSKVCPMGLREVGPWRGVSVITLAPSFPEEGDPTTQTLGGVWLGK